MKTQKSAIISFYELSDEWQAEALENLDEWAEDAMYLEPDDDSNPQEHWLCDLSECMPCSDGYWAEEEAGLEFRYNASIGISNNTAMLLNISDDGEEAEWIIV